METKIASQKLNKNLEQVIESPTEQFESSKKNIAILKDSERSKGQTKLIKLKTCDCEIRCRDENCNICILKAQHRKKDTLFRYCIYSMMDNQNSNLPGISPRICTSYSPRRNFFMTPVPRTYPRLA